MQRVDGYTHVLREMEDYVYNYNSSNTLNTHPGLAVNLKTIPSLWWKDSQKTSKDVSYASAGDDYLHN